MNNKTKLGVLSIILMTVIIYVPGLSGGFLFDDFINLKNISVFSQFEGVEAYIRYIFSYNSGSLKRPVTTLSFLLNSTTWPANPMFFKLTNILIHILNSILLFIVTRQILAFFNLDKKTINSVALLHMAIWTLHPYFVSTTLYIVQRMAMLPVTFILMGMYFYLKGKKVYSENVTIGRIYLFLSIYICTFFAVLSKENGIILPIVMLLFEYIIFKNQNNISNINRLSRLDKYIYLYIPSLVVTLSFLLSIPQFLDNYGIRDFTMTERLMTESRVILYYLYQFFKPEYFTEGVFADVFETSTSFFNPLSTFISILFTFVLIAMAIRFRKTYSLFSFAILFFFVTNIIESSIVPLEMYFEHRGYMSLLFISLPISVLIIQHVGQSKFKFTIMVLIIAVLPVTTYYRSQLWGDNVNLILKSADKYPHSVRAVQNKANVLFQLKRYEEALTLLNDASKRMDNLSLKLNYFNFKCGIGKSSILEANILIDKIRKGKFVKQDRSSLLTTLKLLNSNTCFSPSTDYTKQIIEIIKNKTAYKNIKIKQVVDYYYIFSLIEDRNISLAYQSTIYYLEEYLAYDNVISIVDQFVILKEFDYAEKLMSKMENKVKHLQFARKNYMNEILIIRNHIDTVK